MNFFIIYWPKLNNYRKPTFNQHYDDDDDDDGEEN